MACVLNLWGSWSLYRDGSWLQFWVSATTEAVRDMAVASRAIWGRDRESDNSK